MRARVLLKGLSAVFLSGWLMATAACSSSAPTAPTLPPAQPTIEKFTGTVLVGGSDVHVFNVVLSNGNLNVTLTAAGPPATISMGIGIGTLETNTCTLIAGASTSTPAGTAPQLQGPASAGTYCVAVFDPGTQTAAVTYAVTVSHY